MNAGLKNEVQKMSQSGQNLLLETGYVRPAGLHAAAKYVCTRLEVLGKKYPELEGTYRQIAE